jgi:hypothetical protein
MPKLSLVVPKKDGNGRWTKSDFYTADCPSLDFDDLVATLEYLRECPEETLRRIAGKQTR